MKPLAPFLKWIALCVLVSTLPAWAGKTLDQIKQRDQVTCGVNTGIAGFSAADSQGKWSGMDVDVCRALAAAVLGSPDKVRYVPLSAPQRFTALQSGEVDILSRNTTVTLSRDTALGLSLTAILFYDGQGFMVPAKSGTLPAAIESGSTVRQVIWGVQSRRDLQALKPSGVVCPVIKYRKEISESDLSF